MASFNYHFRPSSKPGYHEGRIFIRLIHGRKVRELTTGYHVFPDEWDTKGRMPIVPNGPGLRTNHLLDTTDRMLRETERVKHVIRKLETASSYTVDDLVKALAGAFRNHLLTAYVGELARTLENNGQHRTARAYLTVTRRLLLFCKQDDLRIDQISPSLIRRHEQWMKDQGRSMNTISFYNRNLRAIYRKAVEERIIIPGAEDPFKTAYTGIPDTRKRALTEDEIKRIRGLDDLYRLPSATLSSELTEDQRDAYAYFMFSFFARGMSSIDMAYLKKANIHGGKISYCRKKTGGDITITLLPELRAIIRYFSPRTVGSPYVFPIIDNKKENSRLRYESFLRKQNILLKELAQLAKVHKSVSTHWARHSWATIARKSGASTARISEGLGHRDEKTTRIYLDSFSASAIDEVCRLVNRAIS